MVNLFETLIFRPILNLLTLFYSFSRDLGVAIIFSTFLIKILLFPATQMMIKKQKEMDEKMRFFQKKFREIQAKYKNDPQKLQSEVQILLSQLKINPFGNFLFLILQIIILFGFWRTLNFLFRSRSNLPLYSFIKLSSPLSFISFGIFDLSKPNFFLAILVGLSQYFLSKAISQKRDFETRRKFQKRIQNFTIYFTPILLFLFALPLPSGFSFAWISLNLFSILEQKFNKIKESSQFPKEGK